MPKITVEQIEKINSKCGNGFELDVDTYLSRGEKKFEKEIFLDENKLEKLLIRIGFYSASGLQVPRINVALWTKSEYGENSYLHSSGYYDRDVYVVDLAQDKKLAKVLQDITRMMSEDFIQSLVDDYNSCTEKICDTDAFTAMLKSRERSFRITSKEIAQSFN